MNTTLLGQARRLTLEDQLALVEALWDDIATRNAASLPTETQKAELDRRLAAHEADPGAVVSWAEVKAAAIARTRR